MIKKLITLFGATFLLGGNPAQASGIMNEQDFTKAFLSYITTARPNIAFEVINPLEIKAKAPERDFGTLSLRNIYELYRQEPARKDELFSKFSLSLLDHSTAPPLVLETLVSVVKAKDWVEDMDRVTMGTEGKGFHMLSEPINNDLFIVYATDTPHSVTYQDREKILALDVSRDKIRQEALHNLREAIGSYTFQKFDRGVYELISATGDYNSSLPLLPEAFDQFPDRHDGGEIVFSIPARNVLIATSSLNKEGISFLHELTQKVYRADPYHVSASIFTIKNGVWDVYKE